MSCPGYFGVHEQPRAVPIDHNICAPCTRAVEQQTKRLTWDKSKSYLTWHKDLNRNGKYGVIVEWWNKDHRAGAMWVGQVFLLSAEDIDKRWPSHKRIELNP